MLHTSLQSSLDAEVRYFELSETRWSSTGKQGLWAVVHGERLLGWFPSVRAGLQAGRRAWPDEPFLIRQVRQREQTLGDLRWLRSLCGVGEGSELCAS